MAVNALATSVIWEGTYDLPPVASAMRSKVLLPCPPEPLGLVLMVYTETSALRSRHLDGFFAGHGACLVIAVAQQDDDAPDGASLWLLQQLVPTCVVESIVHCREAARSQRANAH